MKKAAVSIVAVGVIITAISLGLLVTSVYAQTPTPGPTVTPMMGQGTPVPNPTDLSCGSGNPSGWGTVTLDALWSLLCEQCVDTYKATNTPVPTQPTFTPSPSPTPISGVSFYCTYSGGTNPNSGWTCDSWTDIGLSSVSIDAPQPLNQGTNWPNINIRLTGMQNRSLYYFAGYHVHWSSAFQRNTVAKLQLTDTYGTTFRNVQVGCGTGYTGACDIFDQATVNWTSPFTWANVYMSVDGIGTGDTWTVEPLYHIYLGAVEHIADPTPTPTASPETGYCRTVQSGVVQEVTPWVIWGSQTCFTLIGETTLEALGIQGTVPEITVCLVEVSIANFEIFGMNIPTMVLIYAMLAVWLVMALFKT